MSTIILNGSPKGQKGNSEIFIQHFISGMKSLYEVSYISKEDPRALAQHLKDFDTIILNHEYLLGIFHHSFGNFKKYNVSYWNQI